MSARDELLREMTHNHLYMTDERADELIGALLADHAHELAEQQRQFVRGQASNPFHYGSAEWAVRGVDEAADLIDPQASAHSASSPS